jgi:GalNAc-alpha-(1->4)-GalNAc-alpha-(1->3)-diNAcBac-PP-undecaprenol alpha-1,4-N-acetyl-D-galactosaminyltransferase
MSIMANYWAAQGWEITILTFDDGTIRPFFHLDSAVGHVPLGISRNSANRAMGLVNNINRVFGLRKAIRASRPGVVISFMDSTNVVTLLAIQGLGIPAIVSEHTDPEITAGACWKKLRDWVYPVADRVVVLTNLARCYFSPKIRRRISVIPNPVLPPPVGSISSGTPASTPTIISIGRLDHKKGFDILLRAFAHLKDKHKNWKLTILGEGPMRSDLEELVHILQLDGRVSLPGRVKNPYLVLQAADLFVMSSRVEGFGMALCEALSCGLPVIATDCRTGPAEIITDGVDGLLVKSENVDALVAAMDRLMGNEVERRALSSYACEAIERFSLNNVMGMWEDLLLSIVQ